MQNTALLRKQLEITRVSNSILRNHTTITNANPSSYSNGAHVGGVIQLLLLFFPKASMSLIRILAFHDFHEALTGDVIGSAKVKYPKLGEVIEEIEEQIDKEYKIIDEYGLTDLEWIIHDLIDRADLLLWCFEQYECGCRTSRFLNMTDRVNAKVMSLIKEFHSEISKKPDEYDKHLLEGVRALEVVIRSKTPIGAISA